MFEIVCAAVVVSQFSPGFVAEVKIFDEFVVVELGIVQSQGKACIHVDRGGALTECYPGIPGVLEEAFLEFRCDVVFAIEGPVGAPAFLVNFDGRISGVVFCGGFALARGKPVIGVDLGIFGVNGVQLERTVLILVFKAVTCTEAEAVCNAERIGDVCVVGVARAVHVEFVFFEPLGIHIGSEPVFGPFAETEDVHLAALCRIFYKDVIAKAQIPHVKQSLIQLDAVFACVCKLVGGARAVKVFAGVLGMAPEGCRFVAPASGEVECEVLVSPTHSKCTVVVAGPFVIFLHVLGFLDQGEQGILHLPFSQGGVIAEDFFEFCLGKRLDAAFAAH